MQRKCCLDGMKEIPLSYTCERRAEYILDGQVCVDAFLNCCNEMKLQITDKKEENLQLARSKKQKQKDVGGVFIYVFLKEV